MFCAGYQDSREKDPVERYGHLCRRELLETMSREGQGGDGELHPGEHERSLRRLKAILAHHRN